VVHSSWFIFYSRFHCFKSLGDRRPWCNSHTRHVRNPVHPQTPANVPTYHVARQAHVHSRVLQEFVGALAYTHTSLSHTHEPVCDFRTFRHGCARGTFPRVLRSRLMLSSPITERHTRLIVALTGQPEAILFFSCCDTNSCTDNFDLQYLLPLRISGFAAPLEKSTSAYVRRSELGIRVWMLINVYCEGGFVRMFGGFAVGKRSTKTSFLVRLSTRCCKRSLFVVRNSGCVHLHI